MDAAARIHGTRPTGSRKACRRGRGQRLFPLPLSFHTSFLSLKIENLKSYVAEHELPLISERAKFIYGVLENHKRLQKELEDIRKEDGQQYHQEEQKRKKLAQGRLKQQKHDRIGFLTLRINKQAYRKQINLQNAQTLTQARCEHSTVTYDPIFAESSHQFVKYDKCTASVVENQRLKPEFPLTPPDTINSPQLSATFSDEDSDTQRLSGSPVSMSDQYIQDLGGVDEKIKEVIQNLYEFQQHVHGFRPEQQNGILTKVNHIASSLKDLNAVAQDETNPIQQIKVAPDIIDYVDAGRNPDIYTREFVELVQRGNSVMKGKQRAFRDFSKIFAKALKDNFNGMDDEVDTIMRHAGMEEQNGEFLLRQQNGHSD